MMDYEKREFVIAVVMIAVISGCTANWCDQPGNFGFNSTEQCIRVTSNVSAAWQNKINKRRDGLGIAPNKVDNELELDTKAPNILESNASYYGVKLEAVDDRKAKDVFQTLSKKVLTAKKKTISLKDVKEEAGFDLTSDEISKFKIWDKGVIPYFIDEYSFDKVLRDRIRSILNEVNAVANLQFMELPRPPDDDNTRYIFFINRRGALKCVDYSSENFTTQGLQRVILGYDCIDLNNGMASLILTILGVAPQHNAPDRNSYIKIMERYILPDKLSLFTKLQDDEWLFHDVPYDFESASHYNYHKFSADGRATIEPTFFTMEMTKVGEDKTFSNSDLLKIRMLYNYISRGPNGKKIAECSKMFQPGSDLSKLRPTNTENLKPRPKPAKYFKDGGEQQHPSDNRDNKSSQDNDVNQSASLDDDIVNNDHIGTENKSNSAMIMKLKRPLSAESQKRLQLKQLIQEASDYQTEERKY